MSSADVIRHWVTHFNAADTSATMKLYAEDASLHVVFADAVEGRDAIAAMFDAYFAMGSLECIVEAMHEAGDSVILEWRDPMGLRGCNIFEIAGGVIVRQRNYFDQLTLFRKKGIPIPEA